MRGEETVLVNSLVPSVSSCPAVQLCARAAVLRGWLGRQVAHTCMLTAGTAAGQPSCRCACILALY